MTHLKVNILCIPSFLNEKYEFLRKNKRLQRGMQSFVPVKWDLEDGKSSGTWIQALR
jgi:hypothetical protein